MEVKIVGSIQFKNHTLPVYGDLDEPLFKATDVADLLEYGSNNVWNLTNICEEDEKVVLPTVVVSTGKSHLSQKLAFTMCWPRAGRHLPGHGDVLSMRS